MSTTLALRKIPIDHMDSLVVNAVLTMNHTTLRIFIIRGITSSDSGRRHFAKKCNSVVAFLAMEVNRVTHIDNRIDRELVITDLNLLKTNYVRRMLINYGLQLM